MSEAYILTWNPTRWPWPQEDYDGMVQTTQEGGLAHSRWSCGNTRRIAKGDRVYLFRQNDHRGIIGSGYVDQTPYPDKHWDESRDDDAFYIGAQFDVLLETNQVFKIDNLIDAEVGVSWNSLMASGTSVPPEHLGRLEQLWQDHLDKSGRGKNAAGDGSPVFPEEVEPTMTFPEGAVQRVVVNRYERDPRARQRCLQEHGYACAACEHTMADLYGDVGAEVIHVHHLRELATLGADYQVDPVKDLRPVCPNCHAILHTESPVMTIEKLRSILTGQTR
jgi:5-methylcytosine-specific restriction protein A